MSEEDQDKPESEASGKASSSDSGIEDGKITPTSEEEPKSALRSEEEQPPAKSNERSPPDSSGTRPYAVLNPPPPQEPTRHASAASDRSSSAGDDVDALILNLSGDMSVNKDAGTLSVRVRDHS